jgi:broad specificity phosphatase PhoE
VLSRRRFFAASLIGVPTTLARLAAWTDVPARPSEILLIRHAEKTEPKGDLHLNDRGRARAQALPGLFTSRFARPDVLFAARRSKLSDHAYETIEPLARALSLHIDDHLPDGEYAALATLLLTDPRYGGAHILVCWHHESIPRLATALGASSVPPKWHDEVYDQVWRLRYAEERPTFEQLLQQLLPGDRSGPA